MQTLNPTTLNLIYLVATLVSTGVCVIGMAKTRLGEIREGGVIAFAGLICAINAFIIYVLLGGDIKNMTLLAWPAMFGLAPVWCWLRDHLEPAPKRETPLVAELLSLAKSEAEKATHSYIGAEHLLLALTGDRYADLWWKLGVSREEIRKELTIHYPAGPFGCSEKPPLTPRAAKILKWAKKTIGSPIQNVLLLLWKDNDCPASRVLNQKLDWRQVENRLA